MVERRPGVIPPVPRPPRRRISPRRLAARRAGALVAILGILALALWLATVVIGAIRENKASPPPAPTVAAPPKPFKVVFPEGFTREQMAERITAVDAIAKRERGKRPALSAGTYLAATARSRLPGRFAGDGKPRLLEGFLFPATYDFTTTTSSRQLVSQQLKAFERNWSHVNLTYARSKNLTPYDVLIIASMVEKEVTAPEERAKVAAVIYNRLHRHMTLGIDATIRYALHVPPTESLHESQLNDPTPYNTRIHRGLPPTPIANPGLASMQAAAHPAKVDYLYFVRKPDKVHHYFTNNERDFVNYENKHGY